RGGMGSSFGNRATPQGAGTLSPAPKRSGTAPASAYKAAEEPAVPVSQYRVTLASNVSAEKREKTSPLQSLQLRNFSRIHASSPTGESFNPYASVFGRVACRWPYAPSSSSQRARSARNFSSPGDSGLAPGPVCGAYEPGM